MDTAELERLIKSRRSIRRWQDRTVPEDTLLKAIEMATWSANGGNQQNWRFYVITRKETIKAIADAVQRTADLIASWPEAAKFGTIPAGWRERSSFFRTAPAAIAVAAAHYQSFVDQLMSMREKADPAAAEMRRWRNIADSRIQSVSSAIATLLLALHQMGVGALWMTGPMQAKGDIERILSVPENLDLVAFIPVGYPDESPTSLRKPVAEVTEVVR
jgi:nitroreductase